MEECLLIILMSFSIKLMLVCGQHCYGRESFEVLNVEI